tara:strand:+ start:34250 stop:34777 length:528 start_codon:yes stop_codon:yes gene_type:complete
MFGSKKRTGTGLSHVEARDDIEEDNSPMHVISPRATNYDPLASASIAATPRAKQRTSSFKTRHSNHASQAVAALHVNWPAPQEADRLDEDEAMSGGASHLPVTDMPYQSPVRSQRRKESMVVGVGGLPASPTREAALTSHPVGKKVEEGDRESEERFETPASEGVSGRSGVLGKQ